MDHDRLRAAIGPGAEYYLERFETIERTGRAVTWSWPAFFASSGWLVYRGMSAYGVMNFVLPVPFALAGMVEPSLGWGFFGAYLVCAFVLIPLYANAFYYRHLKARTARAEAGGRVARPPSFPRGLGALSTGAIAAFIPIAVFLAPATYSDYTPRAKVSEAMLSAYPLRQSLAEFHAENKRLPSRLEADKFSADPGRFARSVVYDPDARRIVITLGDKSPFNGKRFAIHAEEKDGAIHWQCRTIDLDTKYLVAACRD